MTLPPPQKAASPPPLPLPIIRRSSAELVQTPARNTNMFLLIREMTAKSVLHIEDILRKPSTPEYSRHVGGVIVKEA